MCRIQLPFFAFIIAILNISMGKSLYIYTVQHFYLDKWLEMELLSPDSLPHPPFFCSTGQKHLHHPRTC